MSVNDLHHLHPPGALCLHYDSGRVLTLSKWLKEARYSFSCSWLMPLASRVKIWFSISLMVRAMVVSSCSQPTRMCCRRRGRHGERKPESLDSKKKSQRRWFWLGFIIGSIRGRKTDARFNPHMAGILLHEINTESVEHWALWLQDEMSITICKPASSSLVNPKHIVFDVSFELPFSFFRGLVSVFSDAIKSDLQ